MKKFRSVITGILLAAVLLTLTGCGSSSEKGPSSPQQTPQPQTTWTSTYETMSAGERFARTPVIYTEDGIYCTMYEKVGTREPMEGEVVTYDGQLDIMATNLYFMSYDGTVKKLPDYSVYEAPRTAPEGVESNFNAWPYAFFRTGTGELISIVDCYESWSTAKNAEMYSDAWYQDFHSVETYFIQKMDENGKILSVTPIDVGNNNNFYFGYGSAMVDDETILFPLDTAIGLLHMDGTLETKEVVSQGWIQNAVSLKDGQIALSYYDNGPKLALLNPQTLELGAPISLGVDTYGLYSGGGSYDLYCTGGTNFYGVDLKAGTTEKLFNWLSVDINPNSVDQLKILEDGTIIAYVNSWNNRDNSYRSELLTVKEVPYESVPQKQTLILATQSLDYLVQESIISFNRKHDNVRIEVRDYSEYNTEDDYSAGATKLTTEIMAGQVPDIIDFSGLPFPQIAAKGLLVDQLELIDKDPELKRSDFFENVLQAASTNGKLYRSVSGFNINTCIGAQSVVGEYDSWTYDDVRNALKKLPAGADIFTQYATQDEILSTLLALQMDDLVDWTKGSCRFDTPEFAALLNFANEFQSVFDWDSYEWTEEDDIPTRISQGKQLLVNAYISEFTDLMYFGYYFGGEDNVAYVGYPSAVGTGRSSFGFESGMGIASACKDPNAAWEFVRTIYTEEYQEGTWQLPVNREAFRRKMEEAMTPMYQMDAEGNKMVDENGEYIQLPKITYGTPNGEYSIYAVGEETVNRLMELIESTHTASDYNEAITGIVAEQSQAFFAGQKSAEAVCRLIQSKANIYVAEQS